MLNIQSKQDMQTAVQQNQERFEKVMKKIVKNTVKRDKELLLSDVLPRLRHEIALMDYFKLVSFSFSLPLISFDNYDVTEEEKEKITHHYYFSHKNYIGKMLKKELKAKDEFYFTSHDINAKTKSIHFTLRLQDRFTKINVQEERKKIISILDEYLRPHFNFETVANKINDLYNVFTSKQLVEAYEKDLTRYQLLTIDFDKIFTKKMVYPDIQAPSSVKINTEYYVQNSKLICSVERKLQTYGYQLTPSSFRIKKDWFRVFNAEFILNIYHESQEKSKEELVKSEDFRQAFGEKQTAYDQALQNRIEEENKSLINIVESGQFDEMVGSTMMRATIMGTEKVTDDYFRVERGNGEIHLTFLFPFNREFNKLKTFKRKYYSLQDGLGIRYLASKNNVIDALKKRYPFLESAELKGHDSCDYHVLEGVYASDDYHLQENTLEFVLSLQQDAYKTTKQSVLSWLSSYYGMLDVSALLKEMKFHEKGISEKIEAYAARQSQGDELAHTPFKIVLGNVTHKKLLKMYQSNGKLYEKTKELFENAHESDIMFYLSLTDVYQEARLKEFQTRRLVNLFAQSLLLNPTFSRLKEELKTFGYDLTIEYVAVNERTVSKEKRNLAKSLTKMHEYDVQLVIR